MTWNWQNLVTLTLVALAVAYLIRASWQVLARKKSPGCGTCAKCPSADTTEAGKQIISLDLMTAKTGNQK